MNGSVQPLELYTSVSMLGVYQALLPFASRPFTGRKGPVQAGATARFSPWPWLPGHPACRMKVVPFSRISAAALEKCGQPNQGGPACSFGPTQLCGAELHGPDEPWRYGVEMPLLSGIGSSDSGLQLPKAVATPLGRAKMLGGVVPLVQLVLRPFLSPTPSPTWKTAVAPWCGPAVMLTGLALWANGAMTTEVKTYGPVSCLA